MSKEDAKAVHGSPYRATHEAVIFDMDGVLVDSEGIQYEASALVLKKYCGVDFPRERWPECVGLRSKDTWERLIDEYHLTATIEELRAWKAAHFEPLLRAQARPMVGVTALVEALHRRGIPLAIASSSRPSYIQIVVESLGLQEYITTLVSGEDVPNGKPAPDVYLLAAAQLGVSPSRCVAVEDAEPGILAAKGAGMAAIAVPNAWTRTHSFARADLVLPSLVDALDPIESLLRHGGVRLSAL